MKKRLCILVAALLMLLPTALSAGSLAAADYVSIKELRETLPQRWTGQYVVENGAYKQLEKGDTVSVDVPIVVPEVDAVPVVRITWEPPIEGLDESVSISQNGCGIKGMSRDFSTENLRFPLLESKVTFDPALPWEEAPTIFLHGLENEYGSHSKEKMAVPASMVAIRIQRPGSFGQISMSLCENHYLYDSIACITLHGSFSDQGKPKLQQLYAKGVATLFL